MKNKILLPLLASLLALAAMPEIRYAFGDINYPPLNGTVRLIYLALLGLSFLFFGWFVLLEAKSDENSITLKNKLIFALILGVIFIMAKPVFSIDFHCYTMQGRVMGIYHTNPYLVPLDAFPDDPFVKGIFWTHRVAFYGPVWMLISGAMTFLAGNSVFLNLVALKTPILIGYLILIWQGYSLAGRICPERKNLIASLLAFNPFIITQYLIDGHHDILMFALALWAVNLIYSKKYITGYVIFTLSVLIKYMSAAIAPFILFILYVQSERKSDFWKRFFIFVGVSILVTIIAYLPFMQDGLKFFKNFMGHKLFLGTKGMDTNTIPFAILMVVEKIGFLKGIDITEPPKYIINIFHLLFLLSVSLMFIKAWLAKGEMTKIFSSIAGVFLAYFTFEAFSFGAWFLIWVIPFILLSSIKKETLLVWLISFAGAVSFWKRLSFVLIGCMFVYFIVLVITSRKKEVQIDV
ncbi:MAG: hypothetical protein P9L90_06620 [Candidatus Aadella gelida]|nr:hypothetical protein [Candidatus Aadella gelida]